MDGSSSFSDKIIQIILASTIKWGGNDGDDDDDGVEDEEHFSGWLFGDVNQSVWWKQNTHTTNDYYCNFVLGKH